MSFLAEYAQSVHSQNGEDGVLREIFRRLGVEEGVFCEFGAWDGKHLSNCYALYEAGWSGWYIEGDAALYTDLARNFSAVERVETIHAFVSAKGATSLDALLAASRLFRQGTRQLDLLSIDIDSDDLAVWRSVGALRAKVVVIEFNPTIPNDVFFENQPEGAHRGNSARAIYETAKTLRYDLVFVTGSNLIFVDRDLGHSIDTLDLSDPSIDWGPRYFFGYDGTLFVSRARDTQAEAPELMQVPWVGGVFAQPVLRPFRRYVRPHSMTALWWALSYCQNFPSRPIAVLLRVREHWAKRRRR